MRRAKFLKLLSVFTVTVLVLTLFPIVSVPARAQTATPEGDKYNNWMNTLGAGKKNLQIIFPDQSKPNNPPYIVTNGEKVIPGEPGWETDTTLRPPIIFKLSNGVGNGSFMAGTDNEIFLHFQAYQVDSSGNNPVLLPNLYFVMDPCRGAGSHLDNVRCFWIVYTQDQAGLYSGNGNQDGYPGGMVLIGNTGLEPVIGLGVNGGLVIDDPDIIKIFSYTDNVPKGGNGNDCDTTAYKTGPPSGSFDGQTVTDISQKFGDASKSDPRDLNANCLTKNGWLAYWGVTSVNNVSGGDCAVGTIFALGDIGKIFDKLTSCILDNVFMPIVTWAADLVTKAAGISYLPSGIPTLGDTRVSRYV